MDVPVTLWLTDEEYAALLAMATRYQREPEDHVRFWIDGPLQEAKAMHHLARWDARKKAIESDAELAATVDRAVK